MMYVQWLRQEAERYRDLAKHSADVKAQSEYEDLAEVVEEVATEVEEKASSG